MASVARVRIDRGREGLPNVGVATGGWLRRWQWDGRWAVRRWWSRCGWMCRSDLAIAGGWLWLHWSGLLVARLGRRRLNRGRLPIRRLRRLNWGRLLVAWLNRSGLLVRWLRCRWQKRRLCRGRLFVGRLRRGRLDWRRLLVRWLRWLNRSSLFIRRLRRLNWSSLFI